MKVDITIPELLTSYDWGEVFGEGLGGNTTSDIESLDGTDCSQVCRSDVAEIIAAANGENDGPEWVGVFRLNDGRFLAASGSCDYTGWDCQAGNCLTVASSLENVVAMGLTDEQRERLGFTKEQP